MSKRKKYGYKNIHVKKELHADLDNWRRVLGFVSYAEFLEYLLDREKGISAKKNNCCCYGK